jgi:hypothetical protein
VTVASASRQGSGYLARPGGGSLAEVIDIILDKGLVIDAYVRDLRFAEAVNRLDLVESGAEGLPELMESFPSRLAGSAAGGVVEGAKDALGIGGGEEERSGSRRRRA